MPSAGEWCAPITGLRCLGALVVVIGHTFLASRIYPFTGTIHLAGVIVPMFFAISGYALYRPFLVAHVYREPEPSAVQFWWKRFLRIYPLWAVALTAYLVLLPGVRPHSGGLGSYLKLYTFLQIYDKKLGFTGIPAGWFLCDEVAFYAALPLLAAGARWLARKMRARRPVERLRAHELLAVAMFVAGPAFRSILSLRHYPGATALPISNLDYYGLGIFLAAANTRERMRLPLSAPVDWLRRHQGMAWSVFLVGCALMNFIAHRAGESFSPEEDISRYGLYTVMVVCLMVAVVLGDQRSRTNRFLATKWFGWFGLLSLHLYLWHQLLLGAFDRYVTRTAEVRLGTRFTTGLLLAALAVVVAVAVSAAFQPLLDWPYRRWRNISPAAVGRRLDRRRWFRPMAVGVVSALVVGAAVLAWVSGSSPIDVRGGVGQIEVTDATNGDGISAWHGRREVASAVADAQGTTILRDMAGGESYRVEQRRAGRLITKRNIRTLSPSGRPPHRLYTGQRFGPGLHEIQMRDGTRLSAFVHLPGPVEDGPYPTVVELSAYEVGSAQVVQPASAAARVMGFATVGVNVRGTGCSGGAFDLFGPAQAADGYDVVEAVAAQPWSARVGLAGFSYSGLTALEAAATRPPGLAGVAAMSTYGDAYASFLHPGGLANAGFPVGWMSSFQRDNQPSGTAWVRARIAAGDERCRANQALHGQALDLPRTYLGDVGRGRGFRDASPAAWAAAIRVPLFASGQFQDSSLGADLATVFGRFTSAPVAKLVLTNGTHADGVAPQILARLEEFLDLFVGHRRPRPHVRALIRAAQPGVDPDILTIGPLTALRRARPKSLEAALASYRASPPVEVLVSSGDGYDGRAVAGSSLLSSSWPPTRSAAVWHLQGSGQLAEPADTASTAPGRFRTDPAVASAAFSDRGSDLLHRRFSAWSQPSRGAALAWESPPRPSAELRAGTASVDLWIRTDQADVDLQAVLTEVDRSGQETYVQAGWLRASHRGLTTGTTELWPVHDQAHAVPLDLHAWTRVRLGIPPFAHAFRAGSRIRLLVGTPGDHQVQWSFGPPPGGATEVEVGQDRGHDSQLALPQPLPDASRDRPAGCRTLRGQPCRRYQALPNQPSRQ